MQVFRKKHYTIYKLKLNLPSVCYLRMLIFKELVRNGRWETIEATKQTAKEAVEFIVKEIKFKIKFKGRLFKNFKLVKTIKPDIPVVLAIFLQRTVSG